MKAVEVWKFQLYLHHKFKVMLLTNDCLIEKCQKKLVIERGQIYKQGLFKERLKSFFYAVELTIQLRSLIIVRAVCPRLFKDQSLSPLT
jgi:hypothetical protein